MKKIMSILLGMVLLLAACSSGQVESEKTLRVAIEKTFSTLNPYTSNVLAEKEVMGQYFEGLYGYDAANTLVGIGAESYEVSEDGLHYTFKLRPEVTWANGETVTASDYEFGWKELVANQMSAFRTYAKSIKNAPEIMAGTADKDSLGVRAVDDVTLEVELTQPTPAFLHIITSSSFYPIHQPTYLEVGSEDYATTPETTMENGPYLFTSYDVGSKVILQKNQAYWDAKNVDIDTIDISVVPELTTQSVLFDSGEIDIIRVQGELADVYNGTDNVIQSQENRILYMYLSDTIPSENNVLQNENFRKALSMAIDKTVITDNIIKDGSVAQDGLFPQGFMDVDGTDYREVSGAYNELMFDVTQAQTHLAKAKEELGVEEITFTFAVQDLATMRKIFENVKAQIEENLPGVTMKLDLMANQIYFPTLLEYNTPAAMVTWSASYIDYQNFTIHFESASSYNMMQYDNAEFDQNVKLGSVEMDPIKQAEYFAKAENILLDAAMIIPLYQFGATYKVNDEVKNFSVRGGTPSIAYKYLTK